MKIRLKIADVNPTGRSSYWSDWSEVNEEVHGLLEKSSETLCRGPSEEWDCQHDWETRITNDPITCPECIKSLEQMFNQFKKINNKWV